ncbi:MAG TPA: rhodanese-like domain-containing protein [Paenibacillaceae bacterium]
MMRYLFWILLAALIAWWIYARFAPIRGVRNVGSSRFARELADTGPAGRMLIDVREPHEFARGHIRGAVNIPLSQFARRIGEIPTDRKIFLYCQSGMRSRRAARMLSKRGCREIIHLNGGLSAWHGETVQ